MAEHWYRKDGRPQYTVVGKNGQERTTTLRDARPKGWVPSVTTVIDLMNKPGLNNWREDQAILAALTSPGRVSIETEKDYLKRIKNDAWQQGRDAAEEGKRIHKALEYHYMGKPYDEKYRRHVQGAVEQIDAAFPEVRDWQAEKTFSHPLGFGGCCDLHTVTGRAVVDSKSKDLAPDDDTRLDFDQFIQLAACAEGLRIGDPEPRLASLFVSRTHPGHARIHVWPTGTHVRGWRVFRGLLEAWKGMREYETGW
jgi:hypothetical protein